MSELTQKQIDELKEIIEAKMQELFDSITYTLEDFVVGEQYDKDGNITDEFLELRHFAGALMLMKLKESQFD